MLKLLGQRDHSRFELVRKLSAKGCDPLITEQAIAYAVDKGWINENRFIESYIQVRKRRGYGQLRIQAELRERGIEKDALRDFFLNNTDDENLKQVFQKKFGGTQLSEDMELRAKQIRFLQYRGFGLEQIRSCLQKNL